MNVAVVLVYSFPHFRYFELYPKISLYPALVIIFDSHFQVPTANLCIRLNLIRIKMTLDRTTRTKTTTTKNSKSGVVVGERRDTNVTTPSKQTSEKRRKAARGSARE